VSQLWIITRVTFLEAARRKILWTAVLAAAAFLALFGTGMHYQVKDLLASRNIPPALRYQILLTILQVGLYAIDMLAVVMTVLTSVDTISGEIASSTIHAMATKPIARWQLLLGKWFGFAAMIAAYIALTFGGVIAVGYFIGGIVPHGTLQGALLVYLECLVLLTTTFFFGTWFSTLTNGVIVLGLHGLAFIGGWLEQIGSVTKSPRLVMVGILSSVIMPSEAIWRRASYVMQSAIGRSLDFSPFASRSAASVTMVGYAAAYLLVVLALALYRFQRRDL
jgi:ABC-type transport system involved in multi-copper enzyme maturation permease subunit